MNDCKHYRRWMDDAVDDDLAPDLTERLEVHLDSCPECHRHMDDLRSLVTAAAALPSEMEPSRDLWPDIEGRLTGRPSLRWPVRRVILAVAALVVVGFGLSLLRAPMTGPQLQPSADPGIVQADNRTAPLDDVRLEYRQARAELLEVVRARSGEVSPETLKVIESNLALIDRAIDNIEMALAANPDEGRLDRHLLQAYHRQIEMLRWAARMPSRT
ncbi:MAG: zf-HC2 domain-containing protein [Acidobacteria bacterium]|nr:zf-HC2 domain-containing protein [Acidobacteriota bacterium]